VAVELAAANPRRATLFPPLHPQALARRARPPPQQTRRRQQRPRWGRWPRSLREQHLLQLLSHFEKGGRFSAGGAETRSGQSRRRTRTIPRRCRRGRSMPSCSASLVFWIGRHRQGKGRQYGAGGRERSPVGAWWGGGVGRADVCGKNEAGPSPSSFEFNNLRGTLFLRAECVAVGHKQE